MDLSKILYIFNSIYEHWEKKSKIRLEKWEPIGYNIGMKVRNLTAYGQKEYKMKNEYPKYEVGSTPDYDITKVDGTWMARIKPMSADFDIDMDVAGFYVKRDAVKWVCQVLSKA